MRSYQPVVGESDRGREREREREKERNKQRKKETQNGTEIGQSIVFLVLRSLCFVHYARLRIKEERSEERNTLLALEVLVIMIVRENIPFLSELLLSGNGLG